MIWKLLEAEAAQFILLYKEADLTVLQSKIKSLSSLIDFLMRYYANIKKIDTNFHYLDMEPDERSRVDESLYKMTPGTKRETEIRSQLNVVLHKDPSQSETDYVNEQMKLLNKYQALSIQKKAALKVRDSDQQSLND